MGSISKMNAVAACIVFWLALVTDSQSAQLHVKKPGYQTIEDANDKAGSDFDVKKYGAKADGKCDDSKV